MLHTLSNGSSNVASENFDFLTVGCLLLIIGFMETEERLSSANKAVSEAEEILDPTEILLLVISCSLSASVLPSLKEVRKEET